MLLIFGPDLFTNVHVLISLIGIVAGFIMLFQMLGGTKSSGVTLTFLVFTVLTSVTGYFFKETAPQPTPAQIVGAVSLALLIVAIFSLYARQLAGPWRWIFVVTALAAQWFNTFVLIIQSFQKVPALAAVAPGNPPGGPVFGAVQGVTLLFYLVTGYLAVKRYRPRVI